MRVLLFIEPAIFRNDPDLLVAHLAWAETLYAAVGHNDGIFAVSSNVDVCSAWQSRPPTSAGMRLSFPIDPYRPLERHGYSVASYYRSLYGIPDLESSLCTDIHQIRARFGPDLVVMTTQNATAQAAFGDIPILNIEQAQLPRIGHPMRMYFDPLGHQVGSMLTRYGQTIRNLPLAPADVDAMQDLVADLQAHLRTDQRQLAAQNELVDLADGQRIALFATQPPNAVPSANAGDADPTDVASLLCRWERELPNGWIGVPTYHFGFRLDADMEFALRRSCNRLRFLSAENSYDTTESLLCVADAVVTFTSSSAMTGLLFGKKVVVAGACPLTGWCADSVSSLDETKPLLPTESAATLAFLTNRYAYPDSLVASDPRVFRRIWEQARGRESYAAWLLDLDEWNVKQARSYFNGTAR